MTDPFSSARGEGKGKREGLGGGRERETEGGRESKNWRETERKRIKRK